MGGSDSTESLVRSRIRDGRLPVAGQHRLFGGQGDGGLCVCCGEIIAPCGMMFEVECRPESGAPQALPMHIHCYHIWRSESAAYRHETPDDSPGSERVA